MVGRCCYGAVVCRTRIVVGLNYVVYLLLEVLLEDSFHCSCMNRRPG